MRGRDHRGGRARRVGLAFALLLTALAATGCGDDDKEPSAAATSAIDAPRDLFISREDISRAGGDTPARTLLRWWQALQFGDLEVARDQYAGEVDVDRLAVQVPKIGRRVQAARPLVLEKYVKTATAKLHVVLQGALFPEDGPVRVIEVPATFRFVREDGKWRLADNAFVTQVLRAQEAEVRARERGRGLAD